MTARIARNPISTKAQRYSLAFCNYRRLRTLGAINRLSSLRKNLEIEVFLCLEGHCFWCVRSIRGAFWWSEQAACLRRNQFGNADQVVGDQVEHEVGGNAADAAMFSFAHRTVLLTPTEDAFDHRATRLRHAIAFVPRGASVDGALAASAGFGNAIVLRHMRCDVASAKIGHMIGCVIGLVLTGRDAPASSFALGLEHDL